VVNADAVISAVTITDKNGDSYTEKTQTWLNETLGKGAFIPVGFDKAGSELYIDSITVDSGSILLYCD